MISHLPLRLAASAFTLVAVLHPDAATCRAPATAAIPLAIERGLIDAGLSSPAAKALADFLAG